MRSVLDAEFDEGSSPLARGTRLEHRDDQAIAGLIPARAGNTLRGSGLCLLRGAHPRSRGEHPARPIMMSAGTGSSPLARGTPDVPINPEPEPGLIPARAGNTRRSLRALEGGRAHPRSRGEHWELANPAVPRRGSSPLARGTRWRKKLMAEVVGLIPARAGNTLLCCGTGGSPGAHPRSRGEHFVGVMPGAHG